MRSSVSFTHRLSTVAVLGAAVTKLGANADLVVALSAASAISGDGASRGRGRASGGGRSRRARAWSSGSRVAVPVGLRLAHALTHGDTPEPTGLEGLNHGHCQVEGCELVDVVGNGKLAIGGWVGTIDSVAEVVLRGLNLDRSELVVVIGIQVEVRNDVAKLLENAWAATDAGRVRGTHVSGVFANDVADSHLVLDHLVVDLGLGNGREILVRPSVRSDLVTLGDHALDGTAPLLINGTLSDVDTSDEEGSLEARRSEFVQDLISVDVWAVIIGNGNGSRGAASIDTLTTIGNVAFLGASIITSAGSSGSLVSVTTWAEVEEAVRGVAVLLGISTVALT